MQHEPKHLEIYQQCMQKTREWNKTMGGNRKIANDDMANCTQWIHLSDAVETGSISPMEAYDALAYGYVPENLKIRQSRYAHLL